MPKPAEIKIANKVIGEARPVFIIAEAGVNHNGDPELGKKLIEAAKEAGADAVKFQTFKTEEVITKYAPKAKYHIETTGAKGSWYELIKSTEIDRKGHKALIKHCHDLGIMFLSTPYDLPSIDMLFELNIKAYKVSSTDANNFPFLRYMARKRLPIILSTGMCTIDEIQESVEAIRSEGNNQIVLTQCTASYPARLEDANLLVLNQFREKFGVLVGYSDHIPGLVTVVAATALGARVYEKHFTLNKKLPGPDHRFSLEPEELKQMVKLIRQTELALGGGQKKVTSSELENRDKLRKSIVARVAISKGTIITEDMLSIKRPGSGLPPKCIDFMVGKKAVVDLKKDELILKDYIT